MEHVNLVFDCMNIRKQLIYDPHIGRNLGYFDLDLGDSVDDKEELATEDLVFQVVSLLIFTQGQSTTMLKTVHESNSLEL